MASDAGHRGGCSGLGWVIAELTTRTVLVMVGSALPRECNFLADVNALEALALAQCMRCLRTLTDIAPGQPPSLDIETVGRTWLTDSFVTRTTRLVWRDAFRDWNQQDLA